MIFLENRKFWAILVLIAGTLSMVSGSPSLLSPNSIITIIPTLVVAISPINTPDLPYRITILSMISAIPISIIYLLWSKTQSHKIPVRSIVLFAIAICLTIPYFIISWSYGIAWQGSKHTIFVASINALFCIVLSGLLVFNFKSPKKLTTSIFNGILFCWLVWYAFPIFGELP